jgi:hypothetical protein
MTDTDTLHGSLDRMEGEASSCLPPGMTQEEADRLVRLADEAQALKEQQ